MKTISWPRILSPLLLPFLGICLFFTMASSAEKPKDTPPEVLKIVVNDTIQPITEEYIARGIEEGRRHDFGGDGVADGFYRHFYLQDAAGLAAVGSYAGQGDHLF